MKKKTVCDDESFLIGMTSRHQGRDLIGYQTHDDNSKSITSSKYFQISKIFEIMEIHEFSKVEFFTIITKEGRGNNYGRKPKKDFDP